YVDIATFPSYSNPKRSNLLPITVLPANIPAAPEFKVTTFAGNSGGPGSLNGRADAARFYATSAGMWGDGHFLFLSDNQMIRRIDLATSLVTTIAGAPYIRNFADGAGGEARLNGPGSIWGIGPNLYVLEPGSGGLDSTLRKVDRASGAVTTV